MCLLGSETESLERDPNTADRFDGRAFRAFPVYPIDMLWPDFGEHRADGSRGKEVSLFGHHQSGKTRKPTGHRGHRGVDYGLGHIDRAVRTFVADATVAGQH